MSDGEGRKNLIVTETLGHPKERTDLDKYTTSRRTTSVSTFSPKERTVLLVVLSIISFSLDELRRACHFLRGCDYFASLKC